MPQNKGTNTSEYQHQPQAATRKYQNQQVSEQGDENNKQRSEMTHRKKEIQHECQQQTN